MLVRRAPASTPPPCTGQPPPPPLLALYYLPQKNGQRGSFQNWHRAPRMRACSLRSAVRMPLNPGCMCEQISSRCWTPSKILSLRSLPVPIPAPGLTRCCAFPPPRDSRELGIGVRALLPRAGFGFSLLSVRLVWCREANWPRRAATQQERRRSSKPGGFYRPPSSQRVSPAVLLRGSPDGTALRRTRSSRVPPPPLTPSQRSVGCSNLMAVYSRLAAVNTVA